MTTRKLKREWAKAMVEMLSQPPITEVKVRKVLRVLGSEDHKQEVLDV